MHDEPAVAISHLAARHIEDDCGCYQRQLTSQECCLRARGVIMGRNIISDLSREAVRLSSLEFVEGTGSDPAAIALFPLPTLHFVLVVASRSWPAVSECSS